MQFDGLQIVENRKAKACKSNDYNFIFSKSTGFFVRWGKSKEDDPKWAPSCEIADIEIVSGGNCLGKCNFCYKCNNISSPIKIMTLDQFKIIFAKITQSRILGQIAFGITNIYSNPYFFDMMKYSKEHGVIPNYTTHGLDVDQKAVDFTAKYCGAVAVSIVNQNKSYDAIKSFTDAGMKQVNCHYMLSQETYDKAFEIIDDMKKDKRLLKMNAIVFLQYKDKNPGSTYHSLLSVEKYRKLIDYCDKNKINYGFDSCSAGIFLESVKGKDNFKDLEQSAESCESLRMSIYINADCKVFPCSFCENMEGWTEGIDLLSCDNFVKDVWFHPRSIEWRKNLINTMENGCAHCPVYDLKNK